MARLAPRTVAMAAALAIPGAVLAAGGVILVGRLTHHAVAATARPAPTELPLPAVSDVLVFVSGAVVHPGLYRLAPQARVAQAITLAGGLTPDADPGRLPDLAQTVHDGRQVNVPFVAAPRSRAGGISAFGRVPLAQRVDVNEATVAELAAVPTMPLGLPEAIVDARTTFGPFTSLAQMRQLLGLETSVFTAVRPWLRAGPSIR